MARIQLIYIPIKSGWTGATHQFILYERDDGTREFIRGGPERTVSLAQCFSSGKPADGRATHYGCIAVQTGPYDTRTPDYPVKDTEYGEVFDKERFDSWYKQTLGIGSENVLEPIWQDMKISARNIGSARVPYCPITQNSNSLASEVLRRQNIHPPEAEKGTPWGYKFGQTPWAPGAANQLMSAPPPHIKLTPEQQQQLKLEADRIAGSWSAAKALLSVSGQVSRSMSDVSKKNKKSKNLNIGFGR